MKTSTTSHLNHAPTQEWETGEVVPEEERTSETLEKINKYENLKTFVEKISEDEMNKPGFNNNEEETITEERNSDIQEDLMKSENIYNKFVLRDSRVQKIPRTTNINSNKNWVSNDVIAESGVEDEDKKNGEVAQEEELLVQEIKPNMVINPNTYLDQPDEGIKQEVIKFYIV
jgi:hypothetical protein